MVRLLLNFRFISPTERNLWYRIEKLGIPVRTPDEAPSA